MCYLNFSANLTNFVLPKNQTMKTITILLLTVFAVSINRCSSSDAKALKEDLVFEYDAQTRGSFSKVIIKNDSLVVMEKSLTKGETINYYPLTDKDWKSLVKEVQKIDRNKIKSYEAPTAKRNTDAARATKTRVIYKQEVYESNEFDEGAPPKEIKNLVDKIVSLYANAKKNK